MAANPSMLIICEQRVWAPTMGSETRVRQLADALGNHCRVVVAVICPARVRPAEMPSLRFDLRFLDYPRVNRRLRLRRWLGRQLRRPRPKRPRWHLQDLTEPRLGDFYSENLIAQVAGLIREVNPECVVVEYIKWGFLKSADPARRCRWVIDTHDIMSDRMQRFHAEGKQHWLNISPQEEACALTRFDAVLAIQETEAEVLRHRLGPARPVIVLSHVERLPTFTAPLEAEKFRIGFIGAENDANRQAFEILAMEIVPTLDRALREQVAIVVAGAVADALDPAWCSSLAAAEVQLTAMGFVERAGDFFDGIDLLLNPVRVGGGLKIKNWQALQHGRPVVTSPVGAEGLPEELKDVGYFVGTGAGELTGLVARLCVEILPVRKQRAQRIRNVAEAQMAPAAALADFTRWLEQGEPSWPPFTDRVSG